MFFLMTLIGRMEMEDLVFRSVKSIVLFGVMYLSLHREFA